MSRGNILRDTVEEDATPRQIVSYLLQGPERELTLEDITSAPDGTQVVQKLFAVTANMAPVARIMAYYIRNDGEVIADSISFDVRPKFENDVSIGIYRRC